MPEQTVLGGWSSDTTGEEHDLMWVVVMDDTGEIWTVANPQVRVLPNLTFRAPRGP